MQAVKQDFLIQERAYASIDFQVIDEDLTEFELRFRMAENDGDPSNLIEKSQADMSVSGDTATMELSINETDYTGTKHYEFWVEYGNGNWAIQFEGKIRFEPSLIYDP